MKIGIGYNGSMIIKDLEGKTHLFTPEEAKTIGKAWYRWVQKKGKEGVIETW